MIDGIFFYSKESYRVIHSIKIIFYMIRRPVAYITQCSLHRKLFDDLPFHNNYFFNSFFINKKESINRTILGWLNPYIEYENKTHIQ